MSNLKSITIRNTKGIKQLTFDFPKSSGVYLLVGPNGCGKTTLLVCIDRICNPYAFARGFSASRYGSGFDEYINSEIEYNIDDSCVLFRKKVSKWSASPRKNNKAILDKYGYSKSIFIKADSKRIDATQDEIKTGSKELADPKLIEALNEIFETDKFSNLRKLKVGQGRGKTPKRFNIIKDGRSYYSEKRFSTGEIAIIRLIESIQNAPNNAIILLDEAEMALHPRVQTNLIRFLNNNAKEKNFTVIVSTHSPTLIKNALPQNIYLFDDNNGNVSMITPCYPAHALGGIDYEDSKIYDYIFFVEDEMARYALKHMLKRYMSIDENCSTAMYSIVPVGGYEQTAEFTVKTKTQLFSQSKIFALLDEDAFEANNKKLEIMVNENKGIILNLGFTPEVYFIETLINADSRLKQRFREEYRCEISTVLKSPEYIKCSSPKPRKKAKKQFDVFIKKCSESSGENNEIIQNSLISLIVGELKDYEIKKTLSTVFK